MSAEIVRFPRQPDISARAADEHLLVALAHRDALNLDPNLAKSFVDFRCVLSGLDGLADYLKGEMPRLSDERVADYLRVALSYYCATNLGARG